MGRLLTNGIYVKKNKMGFDDMRKRHRDADCKYRSKVQFLYFKIKSLLRKKSPKDSLLDNALGFIQDLENDIYQTSGSDHMEIIRNEFLVLLMQEESIWKKEKDITKWWTKVENMLGNDIQMDLWVECNAYQENFNISIAAKVIQQHVIKAPSNQQIHISGT
ncbi:hypothetical protein JTE90_013029 [Oedothorax gibbosus]|uniref:Uncharacterized protein n=1 Tax=Oedothorax gibbosus TaxID=931172 RepID=A0AAV6UC26_9ARAC|nr:hypothetical protein JTE90_013029 [Oedothorax gibbosus]